MRFNPWLVLLLVTMPLFVLVTGLAAAAGAFGRPPVEAVIGIMLFAAAGAAYMAARNAKSR
jgi:hypothetical protein